MPCQPFSGCLKRPLSRQPEMIVQPQPMERRGLADIMPTSKARLNMTLNDYRPIAVFRLPYSASQQ
ncbi:hypothetical protein [Kingella oralis]|uniref:hypothetical protein n=1 Tax=Kingella oralis TaxID=505 RepID=UPI0034E420F7